MTNSFFLRCSAGVSLFGEIGQMFGIWNTHFKFNIQSLNIRYSFFPSLRKKMNRIESTIGKLSESSKRMQSNSNGMKAYLKPNNIINMLSDWSIWERRKQNNTTISTMIWLLHISLNCHLLFVSEMFDIDYSVVTSVIFKTVNYYYYVNATWRSICIFCFFSVQHFIMNMGEQKLQTYDDV